MSKPEFSKIEEMISSKPVAIFMKGSPDFPMCGFSARAIEILRAVGVQTTDIASCDVLEDGATRSAIKEFSNWPTIPQVYIKGQFVGGSDILMEMYEKGELQELLSK